MASTEISHVLYIPKDATPGVALSACFPYLMKLPERDTRRVLATITVEELEK